MPSTDRTAPLGFGIVSDTTGPVWTTHLLRYADGTDPMAAGTGTSGGTVLVDAVVDSQLLGDPPGLIDTLHSWLQVLNPGLLSAPPVLIR